MTAVKFCGMMRPEDIEACNRLRPEYAGFVFWDMSRRCVSRDEAGVLITGLDRSVIPVGVFRDQPLPDITAAAETPGFYRLTVTDDGAGFDPQAVPDDGEPHIGIRNVRERLDRICGGTLSIDSAPGRGSIVTILLPKERSIRAC